MWRLSMLAAGLAVALTAGAQWQLPPGTSSSSEEHTQSEAPAAADAVARAEALFDKQEWAAAAALLKPVVASEPTNAHAQYDLGFALDNGGDAAGAERAYEAAAAADASLVSARVSLGLLLARQGNTAGAEKWLRAATALPENENAKPARAQAERALARLDLETAPDRARDELVAAIRLSREQPEDVALGGEIAEALHDDDAAEKAYARVVAASPTDPDGVAAYVRVLLRQHKLEQAESALQPAMAAHPDSRPLKLAEADLLLRSQRYDAAIPLLEALRGGEPGDAAVTRLLARAYVAAGTPAKADSLFEGLRRQNLHDSSLEVDWADSLIRQKRDAEAEAVLDRVLSNGNFATPELKATAAAKLAFAASANRHPEAVLRAVQVRDEILAPDAATTFLSATAHDTLHHTAKAAEAYREFIQLAGQAYPDEVWQAQQRLQVLRRAK